MGGGVLSRYTPLAEKRNVHNNSSPGHVVVTSVCRWWRDVYRDIIMIDEGEGYLIVASPFLCRAERHDLCVTCFANRCTRE